MVPNLPIILFYIAILLIILGIFTNFTGDIGIITSIAIIYITFYLFAWMIISMKEDKCY